MKLAVVLVHYHAAELAARAYEALAQDLAAARLGAEWVVVDNGSRPAERERLRSLPAALLEPGANLGYAGGANLGVRSTASEHVVLMNPDVMALPGCAAALCAALDAGAAAAGPRFYWDAERRFLLPPTERRTRVDELLRLLAERGERWARYGRRRWRAHARRCWTARAPYVCYELSGALLAFRRSAWEELGGFDEGYRLYFEETDWLERLRRRRLAARFVPGAEAVHLYGRSTAGEPRAQGWFEESYRRFRRRIYGPLFAAFLERLARAWPPAEPAVTSVEPGAGRAAWLEVSSSAVGYPAAARRLGPGSDDREGLPPGTCYLRTVDAEGRELGVRTVRT
ncbi:MAG TPA: glycosyltransferase [Thermoanaerobaculia bacterium]|jgi:N-acetylglucosaminyl-diphospho-decaprenol L-rhamnosyltransferase